MMTNEEINIRDKGRIIFNHWWAYYQMKKRERIRWAATLKIQTFIRMRMTKNSSFVNALQLKKYPRVYFLKEQKPQFMKILKSLTGILSQENMTLEDATGCISEDTKYDSIRVAEPDLTVHKPLPILQFCMPTYSGKTLIRKNNTLGLDKYRNEEFSLKKCFTTRD